MTFTGDTIIGLISIAAIIGTVFCILGFIKMLIHLD